MFVLIWCTLFLLSNARNTLGGNILMTIDLPSPSHQIWHYALAEGLMEKGHNVTLLGPFSDKGQKSDKYHPIVIEDILHVIGKNEKFSIEDFHDKNSIIMMKLFIDYVYLVCNHSYHSKGFKSLLDYPADFKFDLIIIDMTLGSCLYPLIQKFHYPPTIGSTAFLLPPFLSGTFGNGLHPSYIPFYQLPYTQDMNFLQRVVNFVLTYADYFLKQTYEMYELEKLARRTFPYMDSMQTLERHISLLLCNINAGFNQPQCVTPNIIPVGGLHIKPAQKLSADLQRIMDHAKDGVILLCLGTNVRSDKLGNGTIEALLDAFGKLKQTVIWKFESNLENVPKNVIIRQWVPQTGILGHPNMKVFISHGGALSTQEAAYFGVPVIGMPFFIDQRTLVNEIAKKKLGLKIDVTKVTSQGTLDNINEILTNPIYARNMKVISFSMRDQLKTPLETAVFWTEHAMRHNGSHFLSPESRDMSLFVASSIDVKLFLLFLVFTFLYLFFLLLKRCQLFTSTKSKKKDKIH